MAALADLGTRKKVLRATRRRTLAELFARFAAEPGNEDLAAELAELLQAPEKSPVLRTVGD